MKAWWMYWVRCCRLWHCRSGSDGHNYKTFKLDLVKLQFLFTFSKLLDRDKTLFEFLFDFQCTFGIIIARLFDWIKPKFLEYVRAVLYFCIPLYHHTILYVLAHAMHTYYCYFYHRSFVIILIGEASLIYILCFFNVFVTIIDVYVSIIKSWIQTNIRSTGGWDIRFYVRSQVSFQESLLMFFWYKI